MLEALARDAEVNAETSAAADRSRTSAAPMRLGARNATHAGWALAPDEALLWQGRPDAIGLSIRAFSLPLVATYFGVLTAWGLVEAKLTGGTVDAVVAPLATGLLTLAALFGTALVLARSTTYLITTDRVIIRYGAALPRSLSIPYRQIAALSLSVRRGGTGDIALRLRAGTRIPFLKLWPHVRPWRLRHPQPMLCAVADAAPCATRLARWLREGERARLTRSTARPASGAQRSVRTV